MGAIGQEGTKGLLRVLRWPALQVLWGGAPRGSYPKMGKSRMSTGAIKMEQEAAKGLRLLLLGSLGGEFSMV